MRSLFLLGVVFAAGVAGCGRRDYEPSLRAAFESMRRAALAGDYAGIWELLASDSRKALAAQLESFQAVRPGTREYPLVRRVLDDMGLSLEAVQGMDARGYFIATLEALAKKRPDLHQRQIEDSRTRQIVSLEIAGDRARMTTKTASGAVESFTWVHEPTGWKCMATSVAEGVK